MARSLRQSSNSISPYCHHLKKLTALRGKNHLELSRKRKPLISSIFTLFFIYIHVLQVSKLYEYSMSICLKNIWTSANTLRCSWWLVVKGESHHQQAFGGPSVLDTPQAAVCHFPEPNKWCVPFHLFPEYRIRPKEMLTPDSDSHCGLDKPIIIVNLSIIKDRKGFLPRLFADKGLSPISGQ